MVGRTSSACTRQRVPVATTLTCPRIASDAAQVEGARRCVPAGRASCGKRKIDAPMLRGPRRTRIRLRNNSGRRSSTDAAALPFQLSCLEKAKVAFFCIALHAWASGFGTGSDPLEITTVKPIGSAEDSDFICGSRPSPGKLQWGYEVRCIETPGQTTKRAQSCK